VFTCDDLRRLAGHVAEGWRAGADRDWSAPAGTLAWSCAETADHAVDTVIGPAVALAAGKLDGYPAYGISTPGPDADAATFAEALATATRILVAVVITAAPSDRAVIWRRPVLEVRGPEDFVPRAGLELVLHAHDVCCGLGVPFAPPAGLCDRLRRHTAGWPHWQVPGWSPLTLAGDPWADLLRASGRAPA
jgi:hypothetical protein